MGIIDSFLIKSAKNNNIRSVRLALNLNNIKNSSKKFLSKINPLRSRGKFDINNNQTLNWAFRYAVESLNYDLIELFIKAGANVNTIGSDSIRSVIHKYERALAHEKEVEQIFGREYLKDYKEKCCLVLGELVVNGAMPKTAKEKEKILDIFKKREGFNEFQEVVKLKLETNSINNITPPQKPPRTFEHNDVLLLKEPIYADVYDTKISNSSKELSVSEESIYAEVYDSHERSTESLSLEDSGYSSIPEESIYEDVDNFSEQKKLLI